MEALLLDWANLLLRWAHLIAGISWIGTSFYFVALDRSLHKNKDDPPTLFGSAWEVHGGGFYHVQKYTSAPDHIPTELIWYRWEAYLTWVTGMGLMVVLYYANAGLYLIDPAKADLRPAQAIMISLASLGGGWLVYQELCRSRLGRHSSLLGLLVFVMITLVSWIYGELFSNRGALLHTGVFIGTLMAANVFAVIIPNQKKITKSLLAGDQPDPTLGAIGKQRSLHNTWLTLPVLLLMVSGHYPMLTRFPHLWVTVGLIMIMGAALRYLLLNIEVGSPFKHWRWSIPIVLIALLALVAANRPMTAFKPSSESQGTALISADQALQLVTRHCTICHAASPEHEAFTEPPESIILETLDDLHHHGEDVMENAVLSDAMPLGNETGMRDQERKALGSYLQTVINAR